MHKKNAKFNLSINQSNNPSPFKINLIELERDRKLQKEETLHQNKYWREIINSADKIKSNNQFINFKNSTKKLLPKTKPKISNNKDDKNQNSIWIKLNDITKKLAFYWIFALVILLFRRLILFIYTLSYWVGWVLLFFIRFTYLVLKATIKIIIPKLILANQKSAEKLKSNFKTFYSQIQKRIVQYKNDRASLKQSNEELNKIYETAEIVNIDAIKSESLEEQEDKINYIDEEAELFSPRQNLLKPILIFSSILLLVILPVKVFSYFTNLDISTKRGRVLGATETALTEIMKGADHALNYDLNLANKSFISASENFLKAEQELDEINNMILTLAALMPSSEFKFAAEAKTIIKAGELASLTASYVSRSISGLQGLTANENIQEQIHNAVNYCESAVQSAQELDDTLKKINPNNLPQPYQEKIRLIKNISKPLVENIKVFENILVKIGIFLGAHENKRYLLVFQNNSELRASGGFVGSFALVDIKNGKISNIEAPGGGSYDTEAGLYERIIAPEPLWLLNPLWHFWDANWWPDWPTSAKKLAWFYERSNGPTVDGVIGITPTAVERFLAITGPIDMTDSYGEIITADNFWITLERYSEQNSEITNKPKKIIGDLINQIIKELPERLNEIDLIEIVKTTEQNLREKQLLLYFYDQALFNTVNQYGWSGEVLDTKWDYLQVVNTNIGGRKSNRVIKEEISLTTEISQYGEIVNTLKIKHIHNGYKNQEFVGYGNNNWIRIYVPIGSRLIEAKGFDEIDKNLFEEPDKSWKLDPTIAQYENNATNHTPSGTKIYNEFNKTVFANWIQLKPGDTKTVEIKYQLPFKLISKIEINRIPNTTQLSDNPVEEDKFPYALYVQKQPGSMGSTFIGILVLPDNFKVIWRYPEDLNVNGNGWLINEDLKTDKYWALIIKNND